MENRLDAIAKIKWLAEHNRICQENGFKAVLASGPENLEGVMAQYRKTENFIVIDDDEVNRLALMMPTENLTRACTGNNIQVSGGMHRIVTDTAGRAVLDNGRWRIVTPAKIHYEA